MLNCVCVCVGGGGDCWKLGISFQVITKLVVLYRGSWKRHLLLALVAVMLDLQRIFPPILFGDQNKRGLYQWVNENVYMAHNKFHTNNACLDMIWYDMMYKLW